MAARSQCQPVATRTAGAGANQAPHRADCLAGYMCDGLAQRQVSVALLYTMADTLFQICQGLA